MRKVKAALWCKRLLIPRAAIMKYENFKISSNHIKLPGLRTKSSALPSACPNLARSGGWPADMTKSIVHHHCRDLVEGAPGAVGYGGFVRPREICLFVRFGVSGLLLLLLLLSGATDFLNASYAHGCGNYNLGCSSVQSGQNSIHIKN